MLWIELIEITDEFARYKYYPEQSKTFGIVSLNLKTLQRGFDKIHEEYDTCYAAHAVRRIEEYQRNNNFKEKDLVAWY